jgi:hypothetical protein
LEDIMGKQRQSWSVEEKLATVLAVLSEHQSVAEVARQRRAFKVTGCSGKSEEFFCWSGVG